MEQTSPCCQAASVSLLPSARIAIKHLHMTSYCHPAFSTAGFSVMHAQSDQTLHLQGKYPCLDIGCFMVAFVMNIVWVPSWKLLCLNSWWEVQFWKPRGKMQRQTERERKRWSRVPRFCCTSSRAHSSAELLIAQHPAGETRRCRVMGLGVLEQKGAYTLIANITVALLQVWQAVLNPMRMEQCFPWSA